MSRSILFRLFGALLAAPLLVTGPVAHPLSFETHSTKVRGVVHDLTVGDTNGDGRGDVVVATADAAGRHVIVFAGGSSGQLHELWSHLVAASHATDTTIDLVTVVGGPNGPLDLVLNNTTPSFRMGDGDGSFDRAWGYAVENGDIHDAAVGDFDGDGKTDSAVLLWDFGQYLCYGSGNGDGTFTITWIIDVFFTSDADLEFADLDGNSVADAVIGDNKGVFVRFLPGGPNDSKTLTTLPTADIAVADIDGDGHQDPIYTVPGSGSLGVSLGHGDGTFAPPRLWPAGTGPGDIAVADFDGDGHLDVAVTDPPGAAVQLLIGRGGGAFFPPQALPLADAQGQLAAADVNGDGLIDLVLAHTTAQTLTTLINLGGG